LSITNSEGKAEELGDFAKQMERRNSLSCG
jgi:hypothetical protein